MCLTNVATLENSALILFFSVLVDASFSRLTWVRRTFHVVDSFDKNTRFQGHGAYSSGSSGNSCVLGVSAVWSTALELGEHA